VEYYSGYASFINDKTVAAKEGATAVENMYEHAEKSIDLKTVPFVIFTEPQVASVGLKESECKEYTYKILPVSTVAKARIIRKKRDHKDGG
jgi:pyruvate/2-oxoglutarate dehydrogenase complex dihydrolipoamide dehydrogenase (E3) component